MNINFYNVRKDKNNDWMPMLVKEKAVRYEVNRNEVFNEPSKITQLLENVLNFDEALQEEVVALLFDNSLRLLGLHRVSRGGQSESYVDPKLLFRVALFAGASCIILAHNHPSGSLAPSKDDINVTKRVKDGGALLGISVVDHIIVAGEKGGYYSFHENGLM